MENIQTSLDQLPEIEVKINALLDGGKVVIETQIQIGLSTPDYLISYIVKAEHRTEYNKYMKTNTLGDQAPIITMNYILDHPNQFVLIWSEN